MGDGVQGRLDKFQETGGHLSEQLNLEYIRVAADQKSYSNIEDAWDRENQQWFPVWVLNWKGRRAELPSAGITL